MAFTNSLNDHVSVIIRSVGERTEALCMDLVLAQGLRAENITFIRKTPFSLALQASYEAGIACDRPWTLCLDADVLLLPDSIQEMVRFAEQQKPVVFEFRGLVLDKFLGGPRPAGNHLYRTSLLSQALKFIPQEQNNIRPEQNTLDAMKALGFPLRMKTSLIGMHDFEQYYADIYRKCFVHAHKHKKYAEIFVTYWPQQAGRDLDYKIALKGFTDGLEFEGNVGIDAQQDIYREGFEKIKIVEKTELPPGSLSPNGIGMLVKNWTEPPVYHKYFHYPLYYKKRFAEKKESLGFFKYLVYLMGWGLKHAGSWIKELVSKQD